MTALGLLKEKRFYGLFWTQFIGAFTDNFFKQTLIVLAMYKADMFSLPGIKGEQLTYLASGLFMAPFFMFSATAGQLADRYVKVHLIRIMKVAEVFFSILALVGLHIRNVPMLLVVLIFFGIQSTFFGPIKYGILPQLLNAQELVGGNATVEMATNIAILLGTIAGGVLIDDPLFVGCALVGISTLGLLTSLLIPATPASDPTLKVEWNPITPTIKILALLREVKSVFNSVLGISWFWLFGMGLMQIIIPYTHSVLGAESKVETLLLAVFSVGVGVGSLLCERLSFGRLEMGLVPLGSIGISLFCFDLYLVGQPWPVPSELMTLHDFLHHGFAAWRILIDLLMVSVFSGLFIVPLYTLIQQRTRPEIRSQIIAANNIVNAIFMVASAAGLAYLREKGFSLPQLLGLLAILNAAVAVYIYTLVREFALRLAAYFLAHVIYRLKVTGEENIPAEGGVMMVCNHVSFVDWLLLAAAVKRPMHFVMWYTFFDIPIAHFLFKDAGAIPISSSKVKPEILRLAFVAIHEALERGEVVCIFPEGGLSKDGSIQTFRSGVEKMLHDMPVPVVPMALRGLWGGNFSQHHGGFWSRFRRRPLRSPIEVVIGKPVPPEEASAAHLQELVQELRGDST